MKKFLKIFLTILITASCLCVLGYLYGAFYFRDWFCPNTYINGIDVSGKELAVTDEIITSLYDFDDFVIENIGNPYTQEVMETTEDSVTVAEISSFQLETVHSFKPVVSSILNITPDHLNRHHTMRQYIIEKEKMLLEQ